MAPEKFGDNSTWTPHKLQEDSMDSTWSPGRVQVDSIWSPCGIVGQCQVLHYDYDECRQRGKIIYTLSVN